MRETRKLDAAMRRTDVAIVGGGLAGSTAAAMLGRAGHDAILIDPHALYPKDFRCEKLDASQIALLHKTGLADAVSRAATIDLRMWIARFGRVVENKPSGQLDILYDALVNTIRAQVPPSVQVICAKAAAISTGAERQQLTLSNGEEISARLIVLANGLNIGLRQSLGIEREVISPCHSISIGFDLKPVDRPSFEFRALTYYTENVTSRIAYVTLFPIGAMMRANLFVCRDMHDPWLREMRQHGEATLFALLPRLRALTGAVEVSDVKIRPVDLYVSKGYRQAGIVLLGDAFGTSCPAAGTGCNKVFTDVERLCNVHIPRWLGTPGMGKEKIAAFYDDAVKIACDKFSADKAYYLRSLSTETGLAWRARRGGKFVAHLGKGALRQAGERLSLKSFERAGAPARSGAG
jgi:2-polyprenyl-6-methoxyphenol hydroxylase-like FAD-dependent oxidoreductase